MELSSRAWPASTLHREGGRQKAVAKAATDTHILSEKERVLA